MFNHKRTLWVAPLLLWGALGWLVLIHTAKGAEHSILLPSPTLNLPCTIVECYDGDTLTVSVTAEIRVRLPSCYAHELHTRDPNAKALGHASLDNLKLLAPKGAKGVLEIDLSKVSRSDDLFTFGRLLGNVWVGGASLGQSQIATGHAWQTKEDQKNAYQKEFGAETYNKYYRK